ncbi:MAG: C25 family peptidase propeptide domain-containing protein, partial [bacterium]
MRNGLFVLVFSLMGFLGGSQAAWLPVNSPISDQVPVASIERESASSWQMNIVIPGFTLESFTENGQTFQRVSLPDELMASADGEAELPILSRFLALRTDGDPRLEVVSEEWMDLDGTYELAPAMEDEHSRVLAPDYAMQDDYLPEISFEVTPRQIMGGVSLTTVLIRPAKYNPLQKRIRVLKSVELRVHEQGSALSNHRPITETTASILRAVVPNWDAVSLS